jgi:hypothetical protein
MKHLRGDKTRIELFLAGVAEMDQRLKGLLRAIHADRAGAD